jgi:hypothetical protein
MEQLSNSLSHPSPRVPTYLYPNQNNTWHNQCIYISHNVNYRLCDTCKQVYQLLAHGRWFSPGTPVSSTTKTDRPDIAEILLKVALTTKNQIMLAPYVSIWYARVECTFFSNLQSWARTHAVLVIDLYELLGNPTT